MSLKFFSAPDSFVTVVYSVLITVMAFRHCHSGSLKYGRSIEIWIFIELFTFG